MSNPIRNVSSVVVSKTSDGRKIKWSIEFDEPICTLFDLEGIQDPDRQIMVCEALCRIGLAEHRLFGDNADQIEVQEHCYISTKAQLGAICAHCQGADDLDFSELSTIGPAAVARTPIANTCRSISNRL
jgi:hypothetical protein